jgi:pimeloyl-ACP methyl ester carboxylesterase
MTELVKTRLPSGLSAHVCEPEGPGRRRLPVLLLHGMMGGAWQFEWFQPALAAAGYCSMAIDYRGHHDSPPVRRLIRVGVSTYLDDALDACAALGGRVLVVGQALGGLLALLLAEREAVVAAVLTCSLPPRGIRWRSARNPRLAFKRWPAAVRGNPLMPDRDELDNLVLNRMPREPRGELFDRQVPESTRVAAQVAYGLVSVRPDAVRCPVLSIGASDDRLVLPSVARRLAERYGADHLELEHAGHYAIVGEPGYQSAADQIIDWLDQLPTEITLRR